MTPRLATSLFVALALASSLAAQPPAPPRILVQSIVVDGFLSGAAREIVAAQSLLRPGHEYTEREIREAVYRVKRLPFVLDAELSLHEGKEPGSQEVRIQVEPYRAFFAEAEVAETWNGDARSGEDRSDWTGTATAGGRWFLGPRGLAFASADGVNGEGLASGQAGYTHYGLFGRGASASLTFRTSLNQHDFEFRDGTLSLEIPLAGNHSVRANVDSFQSTSDGFDSRSRSESQSLALSWIYDSTDDPLFPRAGSRVQGTTRYGKQENRFRSPDFSADDRSHTAGLELAAIRHWTLTARQSIALGLTGSWARTSIPGLDGDDTESSGALRFSHASDFRLGTELRTDLRWEQSLQLQSSHADSPSSRSSRTDAELSTALALRTGWAKIRLSLAYLHNVSSDERFTGGPLLP
jgi:hypothetical protein